MKRYEYKIVALHKDQDIEEELNKLGEEGWEVYLCRDKDLLSDIVEKSPIYKYFIEPQNWEHPSDRFMADIKHFMEFHLKRIKEG